MADKEKGKKLPKLPKGQRRKVIDKTSEPDQPHKRKREKKGAPRRGGRRGYRGPRR